MCVFAIIVGLIAESHGVGLFMYFMGFALFFVVYVYQWIFAVKVKNWAEDAPNEDRPNINRLGTTMIVTLVVGVINSIATTISEYAVEVGGIIQAIASVVSLVVLVMQVVVFAKMSCSSTLPALAKKGAKSMIIFYIVNVASVIIGIVPLVYGIFAVYTGFHCDEIVFGDTMFIIGLSIIIVGFLVSMFFYYRTWWLISKSELEVLPDDNQATLSPIDSYCARQNSGGDMQ